MWSNEIYLELKNVVKISVDQQREYPKDDYSSEEEAETQASIGGFLKDGSLAWVAKRSHLDVFCNKSGRKLLSYNFECDAKTRNCIISNVQEMELEEISSCVIAVAIQLEGNTGVVMVLAVQGSRLLGRIDINEKVSCLQPVSKLTYSRGRLAQFNGCLAVGTASGKILLVDACLKFEENSIFGRRLVMNKLEKNQCHIEFDNVDAAQIASNHALIRQRGVYFGLQLDSMEEVNSPVIALLDLPALMSIAVGYADGRMALYDLLDLHILHISQAPQEDTPIIAMNLVEPTDDPKACVYIWAFHAGEDGAFAVMHTLMYEEKYAEAHGHVYERFISCSPRLNIACYDKGSFPLGIQSIMKTVSQEEEVLTLCVLSWITSDRSTNILVFDLNQWYKAEMPFTCDWRHDLNHTVVFNIKDIAVNVRLVTDSLIPFNSIHRPEEHFYPNSLSFDIVALNNDSCTRYHWIGLQNKILEYFEQSGSACIMEPCRLYNVMLRAALIPQFIDYNFTSESSLDVQREFLLSVALEYNCYSLLRECALNWADGSHLGQEPEEGVSLSTLTDWIWSRAKALKELSNGMCVPLFDLSGRRIDCGTQKTLLHCSRQLRQLSKICDVIFVQCKQYIPDKVFKSLKSQANSIQLAADYQEVVQWLLNVGLLPEGNIDGFNLSEEFLLVPFPYQAIRSYYASQRTMLSDKRLEKGNPISVEEQSCKYLFIDNFIEREFQAEALRKIWIENNATGVYPPNSMQNVLRALLIPNVSTEIKHILLCYTFMDMTAVLGEGRYGGIVQNLIKFPAVFKLNSATIKRTQAFWFLDHGHIDGAIEELLSPMSQSEQFPHWQREFLISALLRYDSPHLALRALRAPGMPISPFLELKTLLENNLISEAFKLQRSKHDTNLLRCFYEGTLKSAKYEVLLDLALSDDETRILREYLTKTSQPMADNVHFIHLLQKLDFVEAVHMVDKLGRKRSNEYNLEAPKEALTLYHAALEPTTQHLSYLAYAEQKELKPIKSVYAEPLSSRLIRGRADFRSRIYHKSIIAIKEAAEPLEHAQPFLEKPGLGIFQFRTQTKSSNVCYPIKLDGKVPKRKLGSDNLSGSKEKVSDIFIDYEKPKKRRKIESDESYSTSFVAPKSVLTEFRPMKPSFNFSSRHSENMSEKSLSRSPSAQLATPLVRKMNAYNPPSPESVSSYTPHGILKSTTSVQSIVNRRSLSPTPASIPGQRLSEVEDKVLRFDLPESPQVEKAQPSFIEVLKTTPLETPNDSMVSNDEFFSPEGSVVALDDSCLDIKGILSGGPKRRRSIHSRSRSVTPVENNIAIIIEDVVDDSSSKQQATPLDDAVDAMEVDESGSNDQHSSIPQLPTVTKSTLFGRKPLGRLVLEANARKALEATTTVDDIVSIEASMEKGTEPVVLDNEECKETTDDTKNQSVDDEVLSIPSEHGDDDQLESETKVVTIELDECNKGEVASAQQHDPVVVLDDEADDVEELEPDQPESEDSSDKHEEADDEEELEDSADAEVSIGDDEIEIESDSDEMNEDEVENSEASVDAIEEVINISSSSENEKEESHSENDGENSTDDDESGMEEKPCVQLESVALNEELVEDVNVGSGPSAEANRQFADFYSDTVPDVIMEQRNTQDAEGEGSNEVQVSTTTSSTSNVDSAEEVAPAPTGSPRREASPQNSSETENEGSKTHQAEDLTIQQEAVAEEEHREQTPEPSTSRARDLSVPGNDRPEPSALNAEIKLVSPTREEAFKLKKKDKFLGKPKNAHEVDIPAMNLSVKPDEAHEANRKNSKSDESDDSAALNLSTGQIAEALRVDDQVSESENNEGEEQETDELEIPCHENEPPAEPMERPVDHPSEGSSSEVLSKEPSTISCSETETQETSSATELQEDREKQVEENSESRTDTANSGETVSKVLTKISSSDVETPRTPRRTRRMSTDSGDASTSTPRSNVKTRRMSAMEKIEELDATPTKRTTRASSVAPESESPSSPIAKSKRHTSMTHLATPEQTTLTPRRSTRASSLVKELLTSTPSIRKRRTSEASTDVVETKNVSLEDANDSIIDDTKSEISNVSTASRRSIRRISSVSKPPAPSTISEEPVELVPPKPSSSTTQPEEESFAEYSTNRRLTRHQSAIIEKSLDMVRKMGTIQEDSGHIMSQEDQDSESESVVSNISNTSKRSTRSKASQQSKGKSQSTRTKAKTSTAVGRSSRSAATKRDSSDAESVDTDQCESPTKKPLLETISEEADEAVGKGRRRGRPKKVQAE